MRCQSCPDWNSRGEKLYWHMLIDIYIHACHVSISTHLIDCYHCCHTAPALTHQVCFCDNLKRRISTIESPFFIYVNTPTCSHIVFYLASCTFPPTWLICKHKLCKLNQLNLNFVAGFVVTSATIWSVGQ